MSIAEISARSLAAAGDFAKTSVGWQVQRSLRQVGEWIEWVLFGNDSDRPDFSGWLPPDWVAQGLLGLLLAALASWAGWQAYQLLRPYWDAWRRQSGGAIAPQVPAPTPALSAAEWLARSQTAQRQGDYDAACRALYQAALCRLSDRHQIAPLSSRTDGEYRRLVRQLPQAQPYDLLIRTHERLCFSPAPVSAAMFEQCERAYQEIASS
ncbi:MAG: DUF4129 domain-containing protein [Cyanobacteria bacterium J069]